MYSKILVPVDGSPTAELGLQQAIGLGQALKSQLRFVFVVNDYYTVMPFLEGAFAGDLLARVREEGRHVLHAANERARASAVACEAVLLEDSHTEIGARLLQDAADWGAELIVMGTHGRRGLRRVVLGSDAEYVLRHSTVPVLLVRSP
jgi:nucleotide-binding universal stress UspA family protein